MSDGEEGNARDDANDPHRALDINLDEPMEDMRQVPKRPPPALKVVDEMKAQPVPEEEGQKVKKEGKKKKKESKKSSSREKGAKEGGDGALGGLVDLGEVVNTTTKVKGEKSKEKKKKKRSEKEHGAAGKATEMATGKGSQQLLGYEEAIGISTPSKEFA